MADKQIVRELTNTTLPVPRIYASVAAGYSEVRNDEHQIQGRPGVVYTHVILIEISFDKLRRAL